MSQWMRQILRHTHISTVHPPLTVPLRRLHRRPSVTMVASRSTTFVLIAACVVLAVAPIANAHTCLLSPLQRGGAADATTKVADPRCGLGTGPCGGTKPGASAMTYKTGTTPTIHWIKNLNHYNAAAPGA